MHAAIAKSATVVTTFPVRSSSENIIFSYGAPFTGATQRLDSDFLPPSSMHEHLCSILRSGKWFSRRRVRAEPREDRRILAKVLFQSIDPVLIVGVIRQHLR